MTLMDLAGPFNRGKKTSARLRIRDVGYLLTCSSPWTIIIKAIEHIRMLCALYAFPAYQLSWSSEQR